MDTLHMEQRLWEYIDGSCNDAERLGIEVLLQTQAEWKNKYDELLEIHTLIASTTLDEPSLRFTQNVMEQIAILNISPAAKTYINKRVIYGIGGFFIVMITGLLVYCFAQVNWSDTGSSSGNLSFDMSKIEWNRFFNNSYTNVFMMINVILGLMLLDKYLNSRKQQSKH